MDSYQGVAFWMQERPVICDTSGRVVQTRIFFGDTRECVEACNGTINVAPDNSSGC